MTAQVLGIAPQLLVDDLSRAIEYYCERLGFTLDFQYDDFYASVSRDGRAIHLKGAAKTVADRAHRKQEEHLDAYLAVADATALYRELTERGAMVTRPLQDQPWQCREFHVEDLDGYILCFSQRLAP